MQPVENGRFCNDCQKKVVDFTGKTNDEIAAYLMSSSTKVCGRFQNTQLLPAPPKPLWKSWLSAAAMFAAVFMGIKEASAQTQSRDSNLVNKTQQKITIGDTVMFPASYYKVKPMNNGATFPGGEKALRTYLSKNINNAQGITGRVITIFNIEKDGSLTDIKVARGLSKEADAEAIRVLKACPKWHPSYKNDLPIKVAYTLPIDFGN
ncbi:MAG: energy transducer TonB [Janthinobacterium lividum]